MTVLDHRLTPFIEMLADIGLDWLAFELFEGIRRGREAEELPEALMLARKQVQVRGSPSPSSLPMISTEVSPLLGDDQLTWTTTYLMERLEAVLSEASVALDNIDEIVGPVAGRKTTRSRPPITEVVLYDGEEQLRIDRTTITRAQNELEKLRVELSIWLNSTQTDIIE